ncbi:sugar-binding transcriptional regulator [Microvirga sp. GCM10011540]|uniref:sugar-binding transcriptional regulator n=1 Tax=Microvirga sp. GCM10011540 TaxID=3317338 RepID=UPI003619FF09
MSSSDDIEVEAAWLHFVVGLTQAEIADRRGLSRMRVHRLIQAAQDKGYVRVFVDHVPSHCIDIEDKLIERFALKSCKIVPVERDGSMHESLGLVGSAAALFLHGMLEPTDERIIGIGSGRTIAAMARCLPTIRRPKTSFVSVTGDFAALNEANPFEVLNSLVQKTGGTGFALTAPLVVEAREDRDLFLKQAAVRRTLQKAEDASFFIIGIGHVGPNSFLESYDLVVGAEVAALKKQGVVGDLAGHLFDEEGRPVEGGLADRMLSVRREVLLAKPVYAVCSGVEKSAALLAALRSGFLNGLVATADVANAALKLDGRGSRRARSSKP